MPQERPLNILVVCTANIARSPLAEVLLQALFDDRLGPSQTRVHSAGVHARYGDPAARESVRIAAEWGLDLRGHRSQPLDEAGVQTADLIIGMSARHRERAAALAPGASQRAFTLRELHRLLRDGYLTSLPRTAGPRGQLLAAIETAHRRRPLQAAARHDDDIPDPYGGPFEGFIEMANTLVELTESLLPCLFADAKVQ